MPAATLLAVETAGSNCSAVVTRGGAVLAAERRPLRHGHAEAVLPMIDRVVAASGVPRVRIAAVAAAVGPGGFTGIRVGLAAARAIALALGARAIGVSSFAAVAEGVLAGGVPAGARLLVALDSRRAELYVQLFALDSRTGGDGPRMMAAPLAAPQALPPDRLADYAAGRVGPEAILLLAGDAAEAAAPRLAGGTRCTLITHSVPDALGVAAAAARVLRDGAIGAPLRPFYLRPPDVTLPPIGSTGRAAAAAP